MPPAKPKAPEELSKNERLDLAIEEYRKAFLVYNTSDDFNAKQPSVRLIPREYGVIHNTLLRRVTGKTQSHHETHVDEQRLSPTEEEALKSWIFQVTEWGWPPRVSRVRYMACEILVAKNDYRKLGINWVYRYVGRHSELRSCFSQPLDKERAATHDPQILLRWFELVRSTIQKYDIRQEDTYNMDEKGLALGGADKARVICPKTSFQVYKSQDGNREWVSLIECISADGRLLAPFIIFKGKRHMKAWYDVLEDENAHIGLSENGWTSNTLGSEWFVHALGIHIQGQGAPTPRHPCLSDPA